MQEEFQNHQSKACLECGEPLGPGREDRKFCNDICRTAFNNRRRKAVPDKPEQTPVENERFKKIYQIILHNRELMMYQEIYDPQTSYDLRDFLGRGFNLKYFTSEYDEQGVGVFKFCFDFGYFITENQKMFIMERHEEIFC